MRYALSGKCKAVPSNENGINYTTFTGPCFYTGKPYSVKVPTAGIGKYVEGDFIQDAFPELSVDDREFLISGYSPEGWKQVFEKPDLADTEIPGSTIYLN